MTGYSQLSPKDRSALKFEAEEFLYYEAELLDSRKLDEWLNLLTDDIHYWMPIRRTTQAKETHLEFTKPGGVAFFDDDKRVLTMRVERLAVGRAWAEDPPSRTRHLITNVRVAFDILKDGVRTPIGHKQIKYNLTLMLRWRIVGAKLNLLLADI